MTTAVHRYCSPVYGQRGHNRMHADITIDSGKEGIATQLTFPAFHPELLTQNYWNAGENFGRIKIVIAEGILRGQSSAFEKTRSIICFSFQHAPLRKLILILDIIRTKKS